MAKSFILIIVLQVGGFVVNQDLSDTVTPFGIRAERNLDLPSSMADGQWAHAVDELLEELVGVHEHGEMPAANRYKLFAGRFH